MGSEMYSWPNLTRMETSSGQSKYLVLMKGDRSYIYGMATNKHNEVYVLGQNIDRRYNLV